MRRFILAATLVFTALGAQAQTMDKVPQSQGEISLSFAPVVRQAAPAVVNIYAKWVTEGRQTPFTASLRAWAAASRACKARLARA